MRSGSQPCFCPTSTVHVSASSSWLRYPIKARCGAYRGPAGRAHSPDLARTSSRAACGRNALFTALRVLGWELQARAAAHEDMDRRAREVLAGPCARKIVSWLLRAASRCVGRGGWDPSDCEADLLAASSPRDTFLRELVILGRHGSLLDRPARTIPQIDQERVAHYSSTSHSCGRRRRREGPSDKWMLSLLLSDRRESETRLRLGNALERAALFRTRWFGKRRRKPPFREVRPRFRKKRQVRDRHGQ